MSGRELRALRQLKREQEPDSPFIFTSERGAPFTPAGFRKMVARLGVAANLGFPVHPHSANPLQGLISQQITLWNQMGSRVIRGANLLVIPIETSILYVSPLYLRAEHGHLPELKRVIASYGEHVVMKETLADALSALFTEPSAAPAAPSAATGPPPAGPAADRAREALHHYNRAIERLRSGDWAGFGTELDAMRGLLEDLSRHSGGQ